MCKNIKLSIVIISIVCLSIFFIILFLNKNHDSIRKTEQLIINNKEKKVDKEPPVNNKIIITFPNSTNEFDRKLIADQIATEINGTITGISKKRLFYIEIISIKFNEDLIKIINTLKKDSRIATVRERPFATPPDLNKIITDNNGSTFPVNHIIISLSGESSRDIAEIIASEVGGLIIGVGYNSYTLEVPTGTIDELNFLINKLRDDPRIKEVSKNIQMNFETMFE